MTKDEVIALREQADEWAERELQCAGEYHPDFHTVSDERFAALVATHEREACAKVCEAEGQRIDASWSSCAAAIRSRNKE